MAYCGCATPSSKIRWTVMTVLLVLAAVLYVIMWVTVRSCSNYNGVWYYTDSEGSVYSEGTDACTHHPSIEASRVAELRFLC